MTSPSSDEALRAEALRQQTLLLAIRAEAEPQALLAQITPWPGQRGDAAPDEGLKAYRRNALALAPRALGSVFPVVQQMLGEADFAALARQFWRDAPPVRGDLACWGEALPAWLSQQAEVLEAAPWLASTAELEWLVHQASRAPDASPQPDTLALLASPEAGQALLHLQPGSAVLISPWPLHLIWTAHQWPQGHAERAPAFAALREALQQGHAEPVLVVRDGWRVAVQRLTPAEASFTQALLQGQALGPALDIAVVESPSLSFEGWLVRAVQSGWLVRVSPGHAPETL